MPTVVRNIDQFNAYFRQKSFHPLVSIGDLSNAAGSLFEPTDFGCYCVILMENSFGEVIKEGTSLRYKPGTIFTAKPGEVISLKRDYSVKPRGKMLVFRPEMIENTGLGRDFYIFNYFDYEVYEALLLNDSERKVMLNCFANIEAELRTENDELTGHMLRLQIGQMLSYCRRYYDRQFDTKQLRTSDFIKKLEKLLDGYYAAGSELPREYGVPSVAWCSGQFHLSPNYFGNLVKKEAHISALEFIHNKIVEKAKSLLIEPDKSVDQIADQLGFAYANHFTRLFKKVTGVSPTAFRKRDTI
ncbi:MAG: helix-turn-helix domain-containing protein [Bacteroidales bacterium]|nr:helix-turn-helix domain-containing protein [Bacteroidales bacterium]